MLWRAAPRNQVAWVYSAGGTDRATDPPPGRDGRDGGRFARQGAEFGRARRRPLEPRSSPPACAVPRAMRGAPRAQSRPRRIRRAIGVRRRLPPTCTRRALLISNIYEKRALISNAYLQKDEARNLRFAVSWSCRAPRCSASGQPQRLRFQLRALARVNGALYKSRPGAARLPYDYDLCEEHERTLHHLSMSWTHPAILFLLLGRLLAELAPPGACACRALALADCVSCARSFRPLRAVPGCNADRPPLRGPPATHSSSACLRYSWRPTALSAWRDSNAAVRHAQ